MVIDHRVHEVITDPCPLVPLGGALGPAMGPPAAPALDATKFLDIDMDQVPGSVALPRDSEPGRRLSDRELKIRDGADDDEVLGLSHTPV